MSIQNFLIGPITKGLTKDSKPWSTPEDSFDSLVNAYQFRGRTVRRSGYKKLGRLTNGTPVMGLRTKLDFSLNQQTLIAFDTTNAYEWDGTSFIALPSVMTTTWSGTDYQFFWTTNYANAFWATNSKAGLHGVAIQTISNANPAVVTTSSNHGFTTGQTVTIINVSGYEPIASSDPPINARTFVITVLTPTTFSIVLNGALYNAYTSGGIALNSYVSQSGQDGIRYYGVLTNGTGWANYNPPVDPNNALAGALLIFPYRGYLVFLNTWEGNEDDVFNYPNRARWTQIGTPYYSEPVPQDPNIQGIDVETARDDLFGRGGASDAPTNEVIVAAGFIRDILVVFFERSTWRLRFVNNAQNPFVWERINIELGSDCTFSPIIFDKGIMAIGQRGIVMSDGNDTVRIDELLPDQVFDIAQSENGFERVHGIRTFKTKLNFWTMRSADATSEKFPDQVLVFNYDTRQWSIFDDSFTCFGYFYSTNTGYTWADLPKAWSEYNDVTWDSGISEQGFENIVAGNQQGYVLQLEFQGAGNEASLAITAIAAGVFTSANNNLRDGDWIELTGITGTTDSDGVSLNGRRFKVANPTLSANDFTLTEFEPINGGNASGTSYTYTVSYDTLLTGSCQINIGALVFTDPNSDGVLVEAASLGSGTINYSTGLITLGFSPAIASTTVWIRVVSLDPAQGFDSPVDTTGAYTGGGEIIRISNFDVQSKYFNFFKDDQRARLSKIDFYTNVTARGQFTCEVYGDSGNVAINRPLSDNPLSNVVLTTRNPQQIGEGSQTIYRLFCDAIAQTIQLRFTLSDYQMAVKNISSADIEILALMMSVRRGGRLI